MSRSSSGWHWMGAASACVVGVVVALRCAPSAQPPGPGAGHAARAAQPGRAWRGLASDHPALPDPGDAAVAAALDRRQRAAMLVVTAPAPLPPGQAPPLPPIGPRSPEADLERRRALIGWQVRAQRLLDDCVARPASTREPVALDVMFAPPRSATGHVPQQLTPAAISVPVHALQRLWRDTDPDALQGCLDRLRSLELAVPAARNDPPQALSASAESVLVKL
jgi:hypothetical protein